MLNSVVVKSVYNRHQEARQERGAYTEDREAGGRTAT